MWSVYICENFVYIGILILYIGKQMRKAKQMFFNSFCDSSWSKVALPKLGEGKCVVFFESCLELDCDYLNVEYLIRHMWVYVSIVINVCTKKMAT